MASQLGQHIHPATDLIIISVVHQPSQSAHTASCQTCRSAQGGTHTPVSLLCMPPAGHASACAASQILLQQDWHLVPDSLPAGDRLILIVDAADKHVQASPCSSTQKAHQWCRSHTARRTNGMIVQYLQDSEAVLGVEAPLQRHHCPSAGEGDP